MRIPTVVAIAAVGLGLACWLFLGDSDERRIRKLFDRVSEEVRKDGPEPPFTEVAKARALAGHIAPRLRLEGLGGMRALTIDAADLPQRIVLFRRELQTFRVDFDQLTINVKADGTAQAFCNAKCAGLPEWVADQDAFALTVSLEKGDDGWRMSGLHAASFVPQ